VSVDARGESSFRFDGRSFVGLVLSPKAPFEDWLVALDGWIGRSWIFTSRPIIIDFSKTTPTRDQLEHVLSEVKTRGLRVVAVEGVDEDWLAEEKSPDAAHDNAADTGGVAPSQAPDTGAPSLTDPHSLSLKPTRSLVLDRPIRSGETIAFPEGDVTILGSIASGAEVVAGGSIHVYGSLRGRAIAGNADNPNARLFCRNFEPELVAINGLYCTAEEFDPELLKQPVQAWLEGNTINMRVME
jgi:septum site-determining protein MinC